WVRPAGDGEATTSRGFGPPGGCSAVAITRRSRLQVSRVSDEPVPGHALRPASVNPGAGVRLISYGPGDSLPTERLERFRHVADRAHRVRPRRHHRARLRGIAP